METVLHKKGGDGVELRHKAGQGNWGAFRDSGMSLDHVLSVARTWSAAVEGLQRPWLCWNVDDDWCLLQQRLVQSVGWVPVVGFDARVGPPQSLVKEAIVIDFNKGLELPVLYPHFPLEFSFLWCDRLAFWHSDLLVRAAKLADLAQRFEALPDGVTAVTSAWTGWRHAFSKRMKRYWELVGCTTRSASRAQFEHGCGWWMEFWNHPRCPNEKARTEREKYFWDHGAGIYYWHKKCGGKVVVIDGNELREGHCSKIGNNNYVRSWPFSEDAQRHMSIDLRRNFQLAQVCEQLGLTHFLSSGA